MVKFALFTVTCFTLLIAPSSSFADPGSVVNGKAVFMERCFQCHGIKGEGDGPASTYLPRKPRDFTLGIFKLKTSSPQSHIVRDEDLFQSITRGLAPSGMPPWKNILSAQERWDLVAYIKSLSDIFDDEPNPELLDLSGRPPMSSETVGKGRKAFIKLKCHECHGIDGDAKGIKNLKDDYGNRIWPRDLTKPRLFIGPHTHEGLYARLTNCIPLTPMPSYAGRHDDIALEAQRWEVAYFLMDLAEKAEEQRKKRRAIIFGVGFLVILAGTIFISWYRRRKGT